MMWSDNTTQEEASAEGVMAGVALVKVALEVGFVLGEADVFLSAAWAGKPKRGNRAQSKRKEKEERNTRGETIF